MTAVEKVMMNVEGKFWRSLSEMVEELESLDYEVTYASYEYLNVIDLQDEDEAEYTLYLGHANTTMWVESVKGVWNEKSGRSLSSKGYTGHSLLVG